MLARGFKKIHGAKGVHIKIEEGDVRRLVMRRLRGAMDYQVKAVLAEQSHHPVAVTNIELLKSEMARCALESLEIPQCVPRRTEEHAAHVVVHTDYFVTLT